VGISKRRAIDDLRQRVSRLTGEVLDDDFNIIRMVVTGDPEENCYVSPSRHGRYRYFDGKQWGEIAVLMKERGYLEDGAHLWRRVLSSEEMAERDKDCAPFTPEELVTEEDRPAVVDGEPFEVAIPPLLGYGEASENAATPIVSEQKKPEKVYFAGETPEQTRRRLSPFEVIEALERERDREDDR